MKRKCTLLIQGFILILFFYSCTSKEMKKAKEFMEAGMYDQAISLLEIEIQTTPKNAEASFLLGKCFLQTSNFRKVEECFNRAILLNSDFRKDVGNLYFDKSEELYKGDNTSTAQTYYQEGIKFNPSGSEEFAKKLYDYAIVISETNTNPTKPIQIFNSINQISPNYKAKIAEKAYTLAKSFIDKGFVKEGFEYADFGINFDPNHIKDVAELYFNYGNALITSLNKPTECVYYFDRCMTLNPAKKIEIGNIFFNQAKLFERNNEINLLILFAKKSKDINPVYIPWYNEIEEKYKPKIPSDWAYSFPNNGADMTFNGYSDYFQAPSKVLTSSDFSFEIVLMNFSSGQDATIFSNQNDEGCYGVIFYGNSNGFLVIYGGGNNDWTNDNYFYMPKNQWMHYIFVKRSNTTYLFENNVLKYKQVHNSSNANFSFANPMTFGRFPARPMRFWNGKIRQTRFWNRPLSDEEINSLFQQN